LLSLSGNNLSKADLPKSLLDKAKSRRLDLLT
jgi:hypothetical protein